MDRHICRAKRIDNGKWVYGYYVVASYFGSHHMIIEKNTKYDGCGEFWLGLSPFCGLCPDIEGLDHYRHPLGLL